MVAFGRIISMFCLFLNAKLIAVFAGSNGFGVYSLLINLADFMVCLFGLGIANSGIRQIARYRTDEQRGINNTFTVICASVAFCMLLCVILFCLLCREISSFVFATPEHYWSIMLILGYICGKMWSELNIAILNGLQKLRELTLGQIIGAAASSVLILFILVATRGKAIALCLFTIGISFGCATFFFVCKQKKLHLTRCDFATYSTELKTLFSLGICLWGATLMMQGSSYLEKVIMKNYLSWQTIGLYQGGWQLANSSVGIILMAMGCDLMPRLMKNIHDHTLVGKQINEQMELGMTLGALGVVFTLIFAPALLTLFYSSAFITGSNILRFLVTGVFLRIIGFPLAFVVTAQNRGGLFLLIQLLFFSIEYLLLCWLVISGNSRWLGVNYLLAYIFYVAVLLAVNHKIIHYCPSRQVLGIFLFQSMFIIGAWLLVACCGNGLMLYIAGTLLFSVQLGITHKFILIGCFGIDIPKLLIEKVKSCVYP